MTPKEVPGLSTKTVEDLGAEYLNSKLEAKRTKYLQSELEKLGYEVQLSAITGAATAILT